MNILHSFLLFGLCSTAVVAQTDVSLHINHKLESNAFAFDVAAENNLDNQFNVTRLQYYVSNVVITHDGGQSTSVPSSYYLIDANEATSIELGNFDITTLEQVTFGIGLPEDVNHLDPSSYPSSSPLAPQLQSMHWGWSAGYRFVCLEGMAGENLDQIYQLHALGDNNYFTQTIDIQSHNLGNEAAIVLDAEYAETLNGISVESGLVQHGDYQANISMLQNFQNKVFSASSQNPLSVEESKPTSYQFYKNKNQVLNLSFDENQELTSYIISDYLGRTMATGDLETQTSVEVSALSSGVYFFSFELNGKRITEKFIR
ncbi:MAG: MbnP family protein [Flavobacteriales bacterium]